MKMIRVTGGTGKKLRATKDRPIFTVIPVVTTTGEDIDTTITILDTVVNTTDGAMVTTEGQILSNSFAITEFTSLDPSIGTVDVSGYVSWVSNGTVRIRCVTGTDIQVLRIFVSKVDPVAANVFVEWEEGSYARFIKDTIDTMISGISDGSEYLSTPIYEDREYNTLNFARRPTPPGYAKALTGNAFHGVVSPDNPFIGFFAITPRHVVGCTHAFAGNPNGAVDHTPGTIGFIDEFNVLHDRQLTHCLRITGFDIDLYLLDEDLPSSVQPFSIPPANIVSSFLPTLLQYPIPDLYTDRDGDLHIGASQGVYFSNVWSKNWPDAPYVSFFDYPREGTSGHPYFLPTPDYRFMIVGLFTSPMGGPSFHTQDWPALITEIDTLAGISTGYEPHIANLSECNNYGA